MHSNTIIKYFIGHNLCTAARCVICRGSSLIKLSRFLSPEKFIIFIFWLPLHEPRAHFATPPPQKKINNNKTTEVVQWKKRSRNSMSSRQLFRVCTTTIPCTHNNYSVYAKVVFLSKRLFLKSVVVRPEYRKKLPWTQKTLNLENDSAKDFHQIPLALVWQNAMVSMVNNMVKMVPLSFIIFGWVGLSLASNDKLRMYVANIEETN